MVGLGGVDSRLRVLRILHCENVQTRPSREERQSKDNGRCKFCMSNFDHVALALS